MPRAPRQLTADDLVLLANQKQIRKEIRQQKAAAQRAATKAAKQTKQPAAADDDDEYNPKKPTSQKPASRPVARKPTKQEEKRGAFFEALREAIEANRPVGMIPMPPPRAPKVRRVRQEREYYDTPTLSIISNATHKKSYDVTITVRKPDGTVHKLGKQAAPSRYAVYASRTIQPQDIVRIIHDKTLSNIVTAKGDSDPGDIIGAQFTPISGGDIMTSSLYGRQTITLLFGGLEMHATSAEDCVPAAIEATMKRKTPADMLVKLGMKDRNAGTTADMLASFCTAHSIALNLCDVGYNIIHQGEGSAYTINGLIQTEGNEGHLYHLTNKKLIDAIFKPQIITNIKASRVLKCTACKLTFVSQIEQTEHMIATHETRQVIRVDNIINSLAEYIKAKHTIPSINCNTTHFYDAATRYIQKVDPWVHNGISYANVTQYANGILRAACGEKYLSVVNSAIAEIFNQNTTAYVEQYSSGKAYEYDIKKCYTAIIHTYPLPVFAFDDAPRAFSGSFVSTGFYGCRGINQTDGLSYLISPLVRLYLETGRLTLTDVITELIPASTCSLREFVNQVYATNLNANDKKAAINNAIGCLSHHVRTTNQRSFITASDSDYVHHRTFTNQRGIPHDIHHLGGELMLHTQSMKTPDNINARPAWHYIIQMARCTLEKAAHHIRTNGGEVREISTDAIYTTAPVSLPAMFPPISIINTVSVGARTSQVVINDIGQWKTAQKVERAPRTFEQAICPVMAAPAASAPYTAVSTLPSSGCLILGAPGTGKTTLWRSFKKTIERATTETTATKAAKDHHGVKKGETYYTTVTNSNVAELSFQNNVVANLNSATASTFHKKLRLNPNEKRAGVFLSKRFAGIKYIFIDEIQMTPAVMRPFLIWLKQTLGIIFYCAGDFDQWGDINNPFDQNTAWLKEITGNNLMTLTVNHRNPQMDNIHNWELKRSTNPLTTKYHIAYRNTTVNRINDILYTERRDVSVPYVCCHGVRTLGIIKGRHYLLTGRIITLDPAFHTDTFNLEYNADYAPYFTLGYAFTCHKTIGLTITAPYTIHDIEDKFINVKKTYDYVARSRAVSQTQIYTMGQWCVIKPSSLAPPMIKNIMLCDMALDALLSEAPASRASSRAATWPAYDATSAAQALRDDPDLQPDNISPQLTAEEWAAEAEMAGLD